MISDCKLKFSLCLLLLLAASYSASAQLGEMQAQMEARYGKGKELPPPPSNTLPGLEESPKLVTRIYTDGDYTIAASFFRGKCAREDYTRTDGRELAQKEIQTLLNVNRLGSRWREIDPDINDARMWKLSDGGASALYRVKGLSIMTKEFKEAFSDLHHTR